MRKKKPGPITQKEINRLVAEEKEVLFRNFCNDLEQSIDDFVDGSVRISVAMVKDLITDAMKKQGYEQQGGNSIIL